MTTFIHYHALPEVYEQESRIFKFTMTRLLHLVIWLFTGESVQQKMESSCVPNLTIHCLLSSLNSEIPVEILGHFSPGACCLESVFNNVEVFSQNLNCHCWQMLWNNLHVASSDSNSNSNSCYHLCECDAVDTVNTRRLLRKKLCWKTCTISLPWFWCNF